MTTTELKIRLYGDPCLRKKALPVQNVGSVERVLIQSMILTMHNHKGIGLAAPQVGIHQRIFVVDIGDGPVAVINPEILEQSGTSELEEGCLSIPGVVFSIERSDKIRVKYINENNQDVEGELDELSARVFLHEYDHLEGKLITDYADKKQLEELKEQLQEIKNLNKK